jgi:hypothetical protein
LYSIQITYVQEAAFRMMSAAITSLDLSGPRGALHRP